MCSISRRWRNRFSSRSHGCRSSWSACIAPPKTRTAPYESRGCGNGVSQARLHSSSLCPRSRTTSPKVPARTCSPWMTARTSMRPLYVERAGPRRRGPARKELALLARGRRDPDHAADRVADDRRGARHQRRRARDRGGRPLDEEVGHLLWQPPIEDVLALFRLRRGHRLEGDATLSSDPGEQLQADPGRCGAGDVDRPRQSEEPGPRLTDALDGDRVRHRNDALRFPRPGYVRGAGTRLVRREERTPQRIAGVARIREYAFHREGCVEELRAVGLAPRVAGGKRRVTETDGQLR